MTGSYVKTFTSHKVDDPLKEAEEAKMNNVWTDMEKCIFLDRFLQFPKDFRRIASFLRNKTTKDCIAFYYDSKQTVPYKGALKEHIMRRRRKGDYQIWIASVQAAISVGATVSAGEDEEKPVLFTLPSSDKTYRTWSLHPIRRPVLDGMPIDEGAASGYEGEVRSEESKWKSRKRGRDPLFSLDEEQTKFLRTTSQESVSGVAREKVSLSEEERVSLSEEEKAAIEPAPELAPGLAPEPTSAPTPATAIATAPVPIPGPAVEAEETREQSMPPTSARKAPQKWTAAEKRIFAETLEQYGKWYTFSLLFSKADANLLSGRDWAKLAEAVGTKNEKQIKNFYYDWKKGKSRPSSEKKANKKDKISKKKEEVTKKNFTPNVEKKRALEIEAVTEARSEKKGLPPLPEQPDKREMQQQQVESTGQAPALTGLRAQAEAVAREQEVAAAAADAARRRIEIPDNNASANVDYGGGNPELLQHLLNQQLQQQQQQHSHAPQSALQQLLSQQHVQREQQLNQLSLEEARRLLDHHQNPRGPVLSNMLNPQWLGAQQMLQGQSGLSSHAIAAALRGENNALSGGPGNVGELQRILQMQHAQGLGMPNRQNHLASLLLGGGGDMGGTSASNNLSNALLQQLASRGSGAGQPSEHDHLSSLANAQNILGYSGGAGGAGTSNLANALYRQPGGGSIDSGGVSDTLSLLARSMQQRGDGSPHGFGRLHDRSDGSGRCN